MRAIRQHRFGGPEVLELEEVADLDPPAGSVRIAVHAAGVHLVDATIREGVEGGPFPIPDLPMTPGREVAGIVDTLGVDVDPSWLDRHVVAHLGPASGGYSEQAVAPVDSLIPLQDSTDFTEAVAMVGTGRTTLAILEEAAITDADVALITAAAGGIGALAVSAALRTGATVVGVAGGSAKVDLVRSLGAHLAVDATNEAWPERVRSALGERQVSVALDGVGGEVGRGAAFELIGPGGRMVLYGSSSGSLMRLDAADLFSRGVAVTAAIGPRIVARPGGMQSLAIEALAELEAGRWRPLVNPPFGLADAAAAHRAFVERATTGKVVLVPDSRITEEPS